MPRRPLARSACSPPPQAPGGGVHPTLAAALQGGRVRVLVDPIGGAGLPSQTVRSEEQWAREVAWSSCRRRRHAAVACSTPARPTAPLLGGPGRHGLPGRGAVRPRAGGAGPAAGGDYGLEERLMPAGHGPRGSVRWPALWASNDAVVAQTEPIRLVNLQAWVGEGSWSPPTRRRPDPGHAHRLRPTTLSAGGRWWTPGGLLHPRTPSARTAWTPGRWWCPSPARSASRWARTRVANRT